VAWSLHHTDQLRRRPPGGNVSRRQPSIQSREPCWLPMLINPFGSVGAVDLDTGLEQLCFEGVLDDEWLP
jgi:hypothetical protein